MALQKSVGLIPTIGVSGQQVVPRQAVYLTYNPLSDGTVKAGAFCFPGTASGDGEKFGVATLTASASTPVLGFVERVVDTAITNVLADHQDVYPQGSALTVAIRGQYYLEAPESATAGQKVLVTFADGSIHFGASASTETQVDSGWVVNIPNGGTSALKGDLVIIERI